MYNFIFIEENTKMGFFSILLGASLLASVASSAKAKREQDKANKAAKKQAAEQERLEKMRRNAEMRKAIREKRQVEGFQRAQLETLGTSGSSAGISGLQSATSQGNFNAGFITSTGVVADAATAFGNQAAAYNQQASKWQHYGSMVGDITAIAQNSMSMYDSYTSSQLNNAQIEDIKTRQANQKGQGGGASGS